jgi:hypothetical protein
MASVRCPGCGAKNPDGSVKCRICGYDLRGRSELPMSQPKPGSAAMRSGSLKGVLGLAVLGVLAMLLAGVLLGILPGGDVITDIRNKVPLLATESSDGWEEFTEPSARFAATMPVDRSEQQEAFGASTTGTAEAWVSTLGPDDDPDTTLSIQWATVAPAAEGTEEAVLTSMSIAWAGSLGGTVGDDEPTTFQGHPALLVEVEDLRNAADDPVTVRALFVLQRDRVFVIESRSIYADHPQFDRLVNGFTLL